MKSLSTAAVLLSTFCLVQFAKGHISANSHRNYDDVIEKIKNTVEKIFEHLQKQDRYQDIKDLLQIDGTLKKLEEQNQAITTKLGNNLGRSGISGNEIQAIENKLDSMETELVSNVQGGIRKMSDMERQTRDLKTDMDKKLGKMMNVMTSVYEMNQKQASSLAVKPSSKEAESKVTDEKLENMNLFFADQFNDLAKKIDESVQIMKLELKRDLSSLETSISNMFETCDELRPEMEIVRNQCGNMTLSPLMGRSSLSSHTSELKSHEMVKKITEEVVKNLTRSQREINEKLENKLKDLENKMSSQKLDNKQVADRDSKAIASTSVSVQDIQPKPKPSPSECVTPTTNKLPKNCWELQKLGANCDGVYIIYPEKRRATYAFCDMTEDGGGWTVLMRRGDYGPNYENFDRNWQDYRDGFGDKMAEFWLGNEDIHQLSHQLEVVLRVDLEDFEGNRTFFEYEPFSVASEGMNYRLHVGRIKDQGKSYAGYSLRHHNMRPFSTFDKNNDHPTINHAAKFKGGWWYNRGHYALLTAPYMKPSQSRPKWQGMQWHAWSGNNIIKKAEMKIRPKYHNA